jgi:hypothetical protein
LPECRPDPGAVLSANILGGYVQHGTARRVLLTATLVTAAFAASIVTCFVPEQAEPPIDCRATGISECDYIFRLTKYYKETEVKTLFIC